MTQVLPINYDNIVTLAASAFAKSRDCITGIREDVLHNIEPEDRAAFEGLMNAIECRQIFMREFLAELDAQMDCITHLIDRGTTWHECFEYDECNVSAPACWRGKDQSQQAQDLARAFIFLFDLNKTLHAVHDLIDAEAALSELRQAL